MQGRSTGSKQFTMFVNWHASSGFSLLSISLSLLSLSLSCTHTTTRTHTHTHTRIHAHAHKYTHMQTWCWRILNEQIDRHLVLLQCVAICGSMLVQCVAHCHSVAVYHCTLKWADQSWRTELLFVSNWDCWFSDNFKQRSIYFKHIKDTQISSGTGSPGFTIM